MSKPSKAVQEAADKIYDMAYDDNQTFEAENIEAVIDEAMKPEREAVKSIIKAFDELGDIGVSERVFKSIDSAIRNYEKVSGQS